MANKPFPFTVCEECCAGGGGGGITKETDPTVPAWAKAETKPTYTAEEVGALPDTTKIPTKVSELDNDSEYATKEELADSTKWKTLIDVTLTEEQAGVSEILLAIEDVEAFINARQIRIAVTFPVAEAKAVNSFWTAFRICDADKKNYNQTVLAGYNTKCDANATFFITAQIDIFDFVYNNNFSKTFHSIAQLPTPHYQASANTVKTPSNTIGGFKPSTIRTYPPYLNISTGSVTLEAGAHIFMEVCE